MLRLASGSPRRARLLRLFGIPFEIAPADLEEDRFASPARAKADAVARPGEVALAADTEVELDGERIGKPGDDGQAVAMLARLAGRAHDVRTQVALVAASGRRITFAVRSRVALRDLSLREIERYVASGETADRAGGYAIQGVGRRLVDRYEGCLANISGLPLCHVYAALRRAGVVALERPEVVCQEHFDFICPVWRLAQRQGQRLADGLEYDSWSDAVRAPAQAADRTA